MIGVTKYCKLQHKRLHDNTNGAATAPMLLPSNTVRTSTVKGCLGRHLTTFTEKWNRYHFLNWYSAAEKTGG